MTPACLCLGCVLLRAVRVRNQKSILPWPSGVIPGPLRVSPPFPSIPVGIALSGEPEGVCLQVQAEVRFRRFHLILNSCFAADPIYPFNNPAGCYANGQIRAHGDRWREDDCTFCQCINGEPHCVATACGQSCMHPVKVPGECCPVCEGKPCGFNEWLAKCLLSKKLLLV